MEHTHGGIFARGGVWRAASLLVIPLAAAYASAAEYRLGDATVILRGTATLGTAVRADRRDPDLLPAVNAAAIGATGRAPGGQNSDDGNLNYDRGDRTSTVLKAVGSVEVKYDQFGALARVKAWRDFTLENGDVPWGNLANGYAPNSSLSDAGFDKRARFSSVVLLDAYVNGRFKLGEQELFAQLGQQTIPWGVRSSIAGGLAQVNAQDLAARARPGANAQEIPEELTIPVLAAFSRLKLARGLNVEAFYQFKFEPTQFAGCGTFASYADYVTDGCDKVLVGAANDRTALAAGAFGKRAPDVDPSGGQYGVGVNYILDRVGQFGAYFADIHSRRFSLGAIRSTRPGALPPLIPGDPAGANVRYFVEYPESVRIFALNFLTQTPDQATAAFAELTYSPNQILRLNATDLLNAFASNVAPTPLRADAAATGPGQPFHGYDRYGATQFVLGGKTPVARLFGAYPLTIGAEVGVKYVHDLPDPTVRRYGRQEVFGLGPVNGVCAGPPVQCSNAGYVTPFSWGYRLSASVPFPVGGDAVLIPTAALAHDVKGYSYDDVFNEDRKIASLGLRAQYGKRYFADIVWASISGGTYNFMKDRDFVALSVGSSF